MASKSKGQEKWMLISTAKLESGEDSKYFYTITRGKGKPKLEVMKYDPRVRKHVLFKQTKIKG